MARVVSSGLVMFLTAGILAPACCAERTSPVTVTEAHIRASLRKQWYAVYVQNKKLGWSNSSLEKIAEGQGYFYRASHQLYLKAQSAGQTRTSLYLESIDFDGTAPYRMRRARQVQTHDGAKQEIELVRRSDGYLLTTLINGKKATRKIGRIEYSLLDELRPYAWIRTGPRKGEAIRGRSFSFERLKIDQPTYSVVAIDTKGKSRVYRVKVDNPSHKIELFESYNDKGELVYGKVAGVLELKREPEAQAKKLDLGIDLFLSGVAKVNRRLGSASRVTELVLEIEGLPKGKIPNGPRQTVEVTPRGTILCKIGKKYGKQPKATKEEIAKALAATTVYPASNPQIQALAKKAIGDAKTRVEKVKRLVAFVHEFIEPSPEGKGTLVLDLLEKKKGDCTAYAALFTTLARAVGIPAREVSGLAYMGDSIRAFGGHAWNEVVIDGVWHPVDASVGQFEVDAARIYLGSGENGSLSVLQYGSALSIRVIDVQRRKFFLNR